MKTVSVYGKCALALLVMAGAITGSAQYKQPGSVNANDGMNWQLVKTGLYLISGQGSNSLLRLTGNGLVLVDGKLPGNYDALRARIKKISGQPVRALILTDTDASRTGTNAKFLADGTPIVVQENARQSLASDNSAGEKNSPVVTYDRDYQIRLGGVDVQLMYLGNARSNSDTVVYFPNLKVVAVGDLFASTPTPDFAAGGSLVGWSSVLGQILKLDFDTVVPGTGPPITRAELESFKTKIDTLLSRATGLVSKGVPKDQLMAQLKTDDLGWQLNFTGSQLDRFYAELTRTNGRPTNPS